MKLKKVSDKNPSDNYKIYKSIHIKRGRSIFTYEPFDCNIQSSNLRGNDFTGTQTYLHWHTPLPGTKSSLSLLPQRA